MNQEKLQKRMEAYDLAVEWVVVNENILGTREASGSVHIVRALITRGAGVGPTQYDRPIMPTDIVRGVSPDDWKRFRVVPPRTYQRADGLAVIGSRLSIVAVLLLGMVSVASASDCDSVTMARATPAERCLLEEVIRAETNTIFCEHREAGQIDRADYLESVVRQREAQIETLLKKIQRQVVAVRKMRGRK